MRPTCLYCHRPFPKNDVVEAFPYGRRLAWDAGRGRYWIVCARCEKWNLAPLDEDDRASVIDYFERWWRDGSERFSVGEIGQGRYSDHLKLVRIGPAQWNEFAAWRYGEVLRRRRAKHFALIGAIGATSAGLWGAGIIAGTNAVAAIAASLGTSSLFTKHPHLAGRKPVCRVPSGKSPSVMRQGHLRSLELIAHGKSDWALLAAHDEGVSRLDAAVATPALLFSLARINHYGGSAAAVRHGLDVIREAGGAEALASHVAARLPAGKDPDRWVVASLPTHERLALEMAVHEHRERRFVEGELAVLEHEWREAEELAGIIDRLGTGGKTMSEGVR